MNRTIHILLGISLLLNAVLASWAVRGVDRETEERAARTAARASAPIVATRPVIEAKLWASLATDDLPELVARLRAAGFPKEIVRAIIGGHIAEQFAARRRALDPDESARAFWKDYTVDSRLPLAQLQLFREQEKALRNLLGPDAAATDPMTLARQRARFGSLPPEKLDAVQLLASEFDRQRTELFYKTGTISPADSTRIDRELRTALAAILTPAELEDYDLRSSATGRMLRNELSAFNPSEEEFRAIFKLRQQIDEQFPTSGGFLSQEQMRQRQEAMQNLNRQLTAQFGPDRGAEYARATNYDYRQTSQLVARLNLPPDTTLQLWTVQQDIQQRRLEIYRTTSGTSTADRHAALASLQTEAVAKVTPLLGGARGVEAYRQYGGAWIASLVPPPAPAQPRP